MIELVRTLRNPSGLHARPATVFVQAAAELNAGVKVIDLDGDLTAEVDGKSILSMLGLGIPSGHRIRVTVDGPDEAAGSARLAALIESGLGEGAPEDS
ncbi:MAG TPA: HPr family phosphocarrier protein [Candidatus Dormibacteraeota bacterium]|nr:HPr family phosphocarrier protein [Candidatus Dormibacteraeota bacterium]